MPILSRSALVALGAALIALALLLTSEGPLDSVRERAFDVLLADIQMPEKNGLAFLQEIHALSPDLPVIVIVSELNNQFAVDAAELGAVHSLAKPVDEGLLRRTVSRVVGLKQAQRRASIDSVLGGGQTPIRMNATKVKNHMGQVLDEVMQGKIVLITGAAAGSQAPLWN